MRRQLLITASRPRRTWPTIAALCSSFWWSFGSAGFASAPEFPKQPGTPGARPHSAIAKRQLRAQSDFHIHASDGFLLPRDSRGLEQQTATVAFSIRHSAALVQKRKNQPPLESSPDQLPGATI